MSCMAHASVGPIARRREVSPILFGTVLFLASELLFFGGLFAAYFTLRARTSPWPPPDADLDVALATVGTAILAISSFTMQRGVARGREGEIGRLRWWTLATMALGVIFLGIQLFDWNSLDFGISSHAYGTLFYAMTGFHGLHVLAGVVLMVVVLGRSVQGAYRDGQIDGAEAVAYYWHFVDVVWIALYATLFLLR
jgi:cytochrome c oxidase subunit III